MTKVRLEDLIDLAYTGIADEAAFQAIPREIAAFIGSEAGWLLMHGRGEAAVLASSQIDHGLLGAYADHFGALDPYTAQIPHFPKMTSWAFERLVPTSAYVRTEFFNDYIKPNRMPEHIIGMLLPVGDQFVAASFQRLSGGAFGSDDERRMQPLARHLQRALRTRLALEQRSLVDRVAGSLLEDRLDAVFLCRLDGHVVHRNRAARTLPAAVCAIDAAGRLRLEDRDAGQRLFAAMLEAGRRGPMLDFEMARPARLPYRIAVTPTNHGDIVMVTIVDLERRLAARIDDAATRHRLTPSECALVESLLRGRTPDEHAALRGTAIATVRTQLGSILDKTGTRRQAELVALLDREG